MIRAMCSCRSRVKTSPGEALVLNVSTGIGTTVNTVWRTIERITTSSVRVYHEPARSGDVRWNVLDSSRAQRTLQWAPAVPVDDGLRSTWEWFAMRASGQAEVA